MGIFGGAPKTNVAAEQEKLRKAQDEAARAERDRAATAQANKENRVVAEQQADSARTAFAAGVVQDDEESRRKFLKKV